MGVFDKGGGGPDVPSAGDYMDIARTQGGIAQDLMRQQTRSNRPNQVTPFGSTVWEDLGNDQWRQTVALPEDVQAALTAQQGVGRGRAEIAQSLMGRAEDEFGAPIEWDPLAVSELGTGEDVRQSAEDALYGRTASRLDPRWEQLEQQQYNRLWNQGLRPGDEAWDTAMGNLGRERTDAYQTAAREAAIFGGQEAERQFGMDFKRRQQAIAEQLGRRGTSLGEMNALLSGTNVQTPSMPSFSRAGVSQTPDLVGASRLGAEGELARYNADQMREQGLYSGLSQLGSAGILGAFMFSDRRLKTDVELVGHTLGRQPVYRYTMFGHRMTGVMADESPPDAVIEHPSGYLMVDYSRIV